MNYRYLFIIKLIILIISITGCGKKSGNETSSQVDRETAAKADSLLKLAEMHRGFVGVHSHGKNLPLHAHQDPNKKRRILKRQAELAPIKSDAAKKSGIAREKRIKKILEEKKNKN